METLDQETPALEDPALAPDVGVFDGQGLSFPGGGAPWPYPLHPRTLDGLGRVALRLGLRQFWVLPDAMPHLGLPHGPGPWYRLRPDTSYPDPFTNDPGPWHVGTKGGGLRAGFSCWIPGTDHAFEVFLLEWEAPNRKDGPRGGPWGDCADAGELLDALRQWHHATKGAQWHRSGAITSEAWLRDHYRRSTTLAPTTLPPHGPAGEVEEDVTWHRAPLEFIERRAAHCHAFDLNAMYLSAASSLALPAGEPEYHDSVRWGAVELLEAMGRPGYWHVTWKQEASGVPVHTGEPRAEHLCRGWVTAPTLHYLHDAGAFVGTDEGWTWPDHHRFLEPWYRVWRDARAELLEVVGVGGAVALEAVKATYRQGIGRMGSGRRARGPADPLHQPYWRQAVIAEARTRMLRRLAKLRQAPIAVDVDCAWFLTNTAEPDRFARRLGLPMGNRLGQFHHKGSCTGAAARGALEVSDHYAAIAALREAT